MKLLVLSLLPDARVLYASATWAQDPENLACMCSLGLWGAQTGFTDDASFVRCLNQAGKPSLELCAMQLKTQGLMVARTLSFKSASFEIVKVELDDAFKQTFDQ